MAKLINNKMRPNLPQKKCEAATSSMQIYATDNETIFWLLLANEYKYIVYKFKISWTLFTSSKNQSLKTDSFVRT